MKEPKEKHAVFLLECLKGKHLELIRPKEAISKLFDRFFNNLRSFSLMVKTLIILHRALQEEDISQMVAHKIKEKENLLYPYQKEDQSYDTPNDQQQTDIKMQIFICELYINYIKNLINFIIICQLFSIGLKDLHHYTKSLQHKELFLIFSRIDTLIESILKVFEQKAYCQTYRILHSMIYLLFVDLLQIYQSYYLLITVMLEKFTEMNLKDSKRAFIIYLNFMRINKEIRKMATCIISEFNIELGINFYEIDGKVLEALKLSIESRERERLQQAAQGKKNSLAYTRDSTEGEINYAGKKNSHRSGSKNRFQESPDGSSNGANTKINLMSDEKANINRRFSIKQPIQGFQGGQRKASDSYDLNQMSNPFIPPQNEEQDQQQITEKKPPAYHKNHTLHTMNFLPNQILRNQALPEIKVENLQTNPPKEQDSNSNLRTQKPKNVKELRQIEEQQIQHKPKQIISLQQFEEDSLDLKSSLQPLKQHSESINANINLQLEDQRPSISLSSLYNNDLKSPSPSQQIKKQIKFQIDYIDKSPSPLRTTNLNTFINNSSNHELEPSGSLQKVVELDTEEQFQSVIVADGVDLGEDEFFEAIQQDFIKKDLIFTKQKQSADKFKEPYNAEFSAARGGQGNIDDSFMSCNDQQF